MPDPAAPFPERRGDPDGAGPYRFDLGSDFGSGSLASGDTYTLNLRDYTENGTEGYYTVLSPQGYDSLQVTNRDVDNPVSVTVNEAWDTLVPTSSVEEVGQRGMYRFAVTNEGSTAIAQGDVTLEVLASPYDADDAARAEARRPALERVVRKFTGL